MKWKTLFCPFFLLFQKRTFSSTFSFCASGQMLKTIYLRIVISKKSQKLIFWHYTYALFNPITIILRTFIPFYQRLQKEEINLWKKDFTLFPIYWQNSLTQNIWNFETTYPNNENESNDHFFLTKFIFYLQKDQTHEKGQIYDFPFLSLILLSFLYLFILINDEFDRVDVSMTIASSNVPTEKKKRKKTTREEEEWEENTFHYPASSWTEITI